MFVEPTHVISPIYNIFYILALIIIVFSKIKSIIVNNANGFNYDKYWSRHDKVFDNKTPKILKLYYIYWLRKIDIKHSAHIYRILGGKNNFASHPILGHGLNGIIIAGGA